MVVHLLEALDLRLSEKVDFIPDSLTGIKKNKTVKLCVCVRMCVLSLRRLKPSSSLMLLRADLPHGCVGCDTGRKSGQKDADREETTPTCPHVPESPWVSLTFRSLWFQWLSTGCAELLPQHSGVFRYLRSLQTLHCDTCSCSPPLLPPHTRWYFSL